MTKRGAPTRDFPTVRYLEGAPSSVSDRVTVEEPLEIRAGGERVAVTMRTPGHDEELAAGFLFAEGIVEGLREIGRVTCRAIPEGTLVDVVDVEPAPDHPFDPERLRLARREGTTTSSCGICGRSAVEDLVERCPPLEDRARFSPAAIAALPAGLEIAQTTFRETGGLHAAGIADATGRFLAVREDVGRHNAVDKVVGRLLLDGVLPARACALVVSGRASFEIVQKAAVARIPVVVSVSAPSSLAIEMAERGNLTLVAFARGATFNVYANAWRIS